MTLTSISLRSFRAPSLRSSLRASSYSRRLISTSTCTPSLYKSTSTVFNSTISSKRSLSTSSIKFNDSSAHSAPQDDGEKKIYNLLNDKFTPKELKVQDVSGGCGSFYAITLSSKSFSGIPTVKAHRMVNETLKEIIPGIHGLQIKTIAE